MFFCVSCSCSFVCGLYTTFYFTLKKNMIFLFLMFFYVSCSAAERQKMLEDMERDFKDSQHTLPTCSRYKRS
ncbi:unnamed protein product [Brassica oleracea]